MNKEKLRAVLSIWITISLAVLCASVSGAEPNTDTNYIKEVNVTERLLDRKHRAEWKALSGDTDRGQELFVHTNDGDARRMILDVGLSHWDTIIDLLLNKDQLVKATISHRYYFSSPDGDKDFEQPTTVQREVCLYLRNGKIVAARTPDASEANKWMRQEKAAALNRMKDEAIIAWKSTERNPYIHAIDAFKILFAD